jgi:DNA polymerase delta subunit 1
LRQQSTASKPTAVVMKRQPSAGQGDASKKPRGAGPYNEGGDDDFGPTFEDELVMMNEMEEERIDASIVEGKVVTDSQEHRWARPVVEKADSNNTKDLNFQWLDIDMVSGAPLDKNPDGSNEVVGSRECTTTILRLFGVTHEGRSVMACVHGFTPYLYVSFPPSMTFDDNDLGQLRVVLDEKVKEKARGQDKNLKQCILGIEKTQPMQSILGYHFNETKEFIKIYVAMPGLIPSVKNFMDQGTY